LEIVRADKFTGMNIVGFAVSVAVNRSIRATKKRCKVDPNNCISVSAQWVRDYSKMKKG
jgi:hypothetical protein